LLLLPALFILAAFPLIAQDSPEQEAAPETEAQEHEFLSETEDEDDADIQAELFAEDRLYVIAAFEFDIKGRTRASALIYNGEFKTGEKIKGQANLDKYIRDKTQILVNQRVLKDNAVITYSVGEQSEDGSYPVTLTINVEESWNIIALPKPEYTTNTGFELTIKARDYNFLGTMNPLRVDLGYRYDENGNNSFQLEVYSVTPFRVFGYTWNLRFDNLFWYRPDVEQPFFYRNVSGLSMELPFRRTTFTFGFEEYFNLNEENASRYQGLYNKNFQDGLYMSSKMYTSWKIPTGLLVSRYGELTYTPGISTTFNHEFPDWPLLPFRKGPFLGLSHSLGFEKIDWHANFRDGLSGSISNSYTYDFFRLHNGDKPLSASLTLHGAGYFIISKFFSISSRLQYRHWFYHDPDYYDLAADNLRGISDKSIHADYMLSLNMDFPLRILLFTPSKWFDNRKLNFFDVELQIAPVIDLALYHDPDLEISFHPKNIAASGGVELIVFSDFMRNLYIRLGYTTDLRHINVPQKFLERSNNREIYLIMGHFY
jgi:hypothetical protein